MSVLPQYTAQEHRFRFAAWAAGRAYARGAKGLTVERGQNALRAAGLKDLITSLNNLPAPNEFDTMHAGWCKAVLDYHYAHAKDDEDKICYGRAAKLVNVFLKSAYLSYFDENSPSTNDTPSNLSARIDAIHPPIDRILMKSLAQHHSKTNNLEDTKFWRELVAIGWTTFDQEKYLSAIKRVHALTQGRLWKIECFWLGDNG